MDVLRDAGTGCVPSVHDARELGPSPDQLGAEGFVLTRYRHGGCRVELLAGETEQGASGGFGLTIVKTEEAFKRVCLCSRRRKVPGSQKSFQDQPPRALYIGILVSDPFGKGYCLTETAQHQKASCTPIRTVHEETPEPYALSISPILKLSGSGGCKSRKKVSAVERNRGVKVIGIYGRKEGLTI
jgi:hypothetical protein